MRADLQLAVAQLDARPGALAANAAAVRAAAVAARADVLLTPELSLTGYDVRDRAAALALPLALGSTPGAPFEALHDAPGLVIAGAIEAGPETVPYNVAMGVAGASIRHLHRKIYLPTYGMFDEARWFGSGGKLEPWSLPGGWRAGVLVCEDFWHPGLVYVLASAGIDVLLVLAAAPGRGVWEGGAHGDFASADAWEGIACTTARLYGIYVALANRVGVEGAVTFAGGSLIVSPEGVVLARAPALEPATIRATLEPNALARARRPAFHGRDDDPRLVARELLRHHG
ncbi:MAG TPA: nitrilase-related carbon-nitrogen hydrolase [Longimicrobiales bacterium]|nr:nitrilase-related carbon-nitrogen hydrolase [Longimicrobiales bacterium]